LGTNLPLILNVPCKSFAIQRSLKLSKKNKAKDSTAKTKNKPKPIKGKKQPKKKTKK